MIEHISREINKKKHSILINHIVDEIQIDALSKFGNMIIKPACKTLCYSKLLQLYTTISPPLRAFQPKLFYHFT